MWRLWRGPYMTVLIVPPLVPSYIYWLLTTATDILWSMCSTAAMAISLILHHIPQKVTETESEATGKPAAHRQFQWVGGGLFVSFYTIRFACGAHEERFKVQNGMFSSDNELDFRQIELPWLANLSSISRWIFLMSSDMGRNWFPHLLTEVLRIIMSYWFLVELWRNPTHDSMCVSF